MATKRTVAIAIDDSEHSTFAFHFYVEHVRKPEDHVVLIHVPEYNNVVKDSSLLTDPEIVAELLKDTEERTQELVDVYTMKMRDLQIEGHVRQQCGKPGEAIIEAIREEEASMLILGTRGRGRFRRTFLGSVSDYCLHHSRVPVIICRHKTLKHCVEHDKDEKHGISTP